MWIMERGKIAWRYYKILSIDIKNSWNKALKVDIGIIPNAVRPGPRPRRAKSGLNVTCTLNPFTDRIRQTRSIWGPSSGLNDSCHVKRIIRKFARKCHPQGNQLWTLVIFIATWNLIIIIHSNIVFLVAVGVRAQRRRRQKVQGQGGIQSNQA